MADVGWRAPLTRGGICDYPKRGRAQLGQAGARIAVETGTLFGDGAEELRQQFKEAHTIGIHAQLHAFAQKRFAEFPQVHCHFGDSVAVLRELAPRLLEPPLFFLDAHWSGGRVTPWGRSRFKGYGVETGHRGDPSAGAASLATSAAR